MLVRTLSSIVFLLVVLPCIYFSGTTLFVAFVAFLSVRAIYEMLRCNGLHKNIPLSISMYPLSILPILARYVDDTRVYAIIFPFIFTCSLLVLSVYTFMKEKPELGKVISTWFFSLFAVSGFTSLILLTGMTDGTWHIMFFAFVAAWVTDSCALITGLLFGKHKLLPSVSPKKTIEGAIGGVVFCIVAFVLYAKLLEVFFEYQVKSYILIALCGLICALVAVIGDLLFSAVKRASGIKDFGRLMPGHGGVLDRFDSLIAIAIVLLMFISVTDIF